MEYQMHVQGAPQDQKNSRLRRGFFGDIAELRSELLRLGMAFVSPLPEFPDNDHLDRTDFHGEQPVSERARAYVQVLERTLADHGTGPLHDDYVPGIPLHKLSSADDWHVTDAECAEALAAFAAADYVSPASPVLEVLPFLRNAVAHQGFRVTDR